MLGTVKSDNLEYCLKNLIAIDPAPIEDLKDEMKLMDLTRVNVQLLLNKIFALSKTSNSDGIFANLPSEDLIKMPRVYSLPKPKQKTRWELFAEMKGIKKRKRSRMVFDKVANDWVPRWGYKSIKKKITPIVEGDKVGVFEENSRKRNLAKTKQKLRELRNIDERNKTDLGRMKVSTRGCGKHGKTVKSVKKRISTKINVQSLESEKKSYVNNIKKLLK